MTEKLILRQILVGLIAAFLSTIPAIAQTTAFTYQGKLTDNGAAQNTYQMQFALFDAAAGGSQIGGTMTNSSVAVNQGVFTVQLDFGASVFTGADRFLQISVRRNASETYTILSPREKIASSPYSVRTLSAAQADVSLDSNKLGGVLASEYVTNATVGSSFIKNAATLQTANFNINGNGFVGGNFGVGTTSPTSKFQVFSSGYGITQTNGAVTLGSFISSADGGSGWLGTRSNHSLNFFTSDSLPQMTLTTAGNFGIGITNPTARLQVLSSVAGTTGIFAESSSGRAVWGKSVTSRGVYGESDSLEGVYGISDTGAGVAGRSRANTGVYGEGTSSVGVGVYARNLFGGRAFFAEGNAAQSLSSNGLVKAMLFVEADATIIRCYNGVTNSSTGNCGFSISKAASSYLINFGFQVNNRFAVVTSGLSGSAFANSMLRYFSQNEIQVFTFVEGNSTGDANFTIIVY
ncbi:MAG TPA: hypothetical protein VGC97_21885 [Pyrinomonadaceae bacterium]|jgi:hypothetical protein